MDFAPALRGPGNSHRMVARGLGGLERLSLNVMNRENKVFWLHNSKQIQFRMCTAPATQSSSMLQVHPVTTEHPHTGTDFFSTASTSMLEEISAHGGNISIKIP